MQHVFYICHIQTLMSPSYNDYLNTNVLIRSYSFYFVRNRIIQNNVLD